ncbi:hypothetical protein [Elizabethkingia anophelis]|uniref:hypothetical protein n=1 Tax=Elizabethkingia anophelis TaxID=1117645 RepID=UPI003891C065
MAKVETLTFKIGSEEFSSNINVGKSGIFTIRLNWQVAEALGFKNNYMESSKLSDLRQPIMSKYLEYVQSETQKDAFIEIVFKANGYYSDNQWDNQFKLSTFSDYNNVIQFKYRLFIREKRNENSTWFDAKELGNFTENTLNSFRGSSNVVCGLLKGGMRISKPSGVLIPYSANAVETLENTKQSFKKLSEIIYSFLTQSPEQIEQSLTAGKLLN